MTMGGIRVTVADIVTSGLDRSVAVMTIVCAVGIAAGAVYKPDEVIVPTPAGLMDHDATEELHVIE